MKINRLFQKLFLDGIWYVGIRNYLNVTSKTYKIIPPPNGQWIADPFLYEYGGQHYLFVEQYIQEENHACLGCYEIIDGIPTNYHVIIKNPYHMSYPCVFFFKGHHYIIPESSANNTIDLYEAKEFPFIWEHKKTLLEGEKYVDSTVFKNKDKLMLLSYKKASVGWFIVLFEVDLEKGVLIKLSESKYNINTGRPAGLLYIDDNSLYRPSQDCSVKYGESIIINKVDKDKFFNECIIKEYPQSRIEYKVIDVPIKVKRIHTINRDTKYEVVDLFQEKIDLFRAIKILKRKFKL